METNISRLNENEDAVEFGVFFSYTELEDAYDGLHTYWVPKALKEEVYRLIKEARRHELPWGEVEEFLYRHKLE